MKMTPFKTEQWMTDHENDAVFNLTDTCVQPLHMKELLQLDSDGVLDDVVLDYGTITGLLPLKKEIASLYRKADPENITMAHGCSQANEMVMNEILQPGDHVIAFTPSYEQFVRIPESLGCTVTELVLHEEKGWQPDVEDLRRAFRQNTKMILFNSPNNPTGTVFEREFLDACASLCRKNGCWMFADEVYRSASQPSLFDLYPHTVVTGSLSKMYSLAGLRLGWIAADRQLIDRLNFRRDYSIISEGPLAEAAGLAALKAKKQILARSESIISESKAAVTEWLKREPRAHVQLPESGTVAFLKYDAAMDSRTLAERLLKEEGVFFVPGWCFDCEYHLRLGLTRGRKTMEKGLALFSGFLDRCSSHESV